MYTKLGDIPAILSEAIVNDSLVSWINASEWNCENRRNRLISFGAQPTNLANRLNVTNTALRGKLKSTEISSNTGRFVWEGNQLNGYAAMASNQIPSDLTKGTGSSLSAIIFGNFSDLIVGSWGPGIELLVNPYSKDKEGVIRIVGFSFVDVGIRHPESFCRVVDAVTS